MKDSSAWRRRASWLALALALSGGGLAYLRDPPWLLGVDSGFGRWERDPSGQRYRWICGRASFFVPSEVLRLDIPMRARFMGEDRRPLLVRVDVNDTPAALARLRDETWAVARVPVVVPPSWSRRVVRVDLHVDHIWDDCRVVQVGETTHRSFEAGVRGTGTSGR